MEKNDVMRLHDIWALESIEGDKIVIDDSMEYLPMIEIYVEDERIHGNTGCNSFNCEIVIDENQIAFTNIIATGKEGIST